MKVFVAGGTGAIGKQLVPQLVAAGHDVVATTRSERGAGIVREMGGQPAIVRAARQAGARRLIAQSYAGWPNAREGAAVKTEEDPLNPDPPKWMRESLAAIRHVETTVPAAGGPEGVVLRYGALYAHGTGMLAPEALDLIRKRQFPLVGDGSGVWSFIHVADAAEATVAAVEHGSRGIYNVVDDDPAAVAEWLPAPAKELTAKKPMRVPRFIGRLFAGQFGVVLMTELRGASNATAKRELAWRPAQPSWREGLAAV